MTNDDRLSAASNPRPLIFHKVSPACVVRVSGKETKQADSGLSDKIDHLWNAAVSDGYQQLFDGQLYSVTDVEADVITVTRASYRHFFAQSREPSLFEPFFIRPIAVTTVLECPDGLVFGRRSDDVAFDKSLWELGPSGTIDDSAETQDGYLDWRITVLEELQEELGVRGLEEQAFKLSGALEDTVLHSVDLIAPIKTTLTRNQIEQVFLRRRTQEYTDIAVVPRRELSTFAKTTAGEMTPVCLDILNRISHP